MFLMDDVRRWKAVYRLLNQVETEVFDCGTLCGSACCACAGNREEMGIYLFPGEHLLLQEAAAKGEDGSPTLLMKAVSSMKLFRNGKKGIIYNESLQEFCEKTGRPAEGYAGASGRNELIADMFIMQEAGTGQGLSGIESKVGEGRSSILIDWMYEIYSIMTAVRRYMPDKYERIMSFHWTKSEEKLKDLFLEVAAMIAAIENQNKAIC